MASYFVASHAQPDGAHAVHERSRCPPHCFPEHASEYLGEFGNAAQALAVARVRYAQAFSCACCEPAPAASSGLPPLNARSLSSLRS